MMTLGMGVVRAALVGTVALGCTSHRPGGNALNVAVQARRFEIRTDSTRYAVRRSREYLEATFGATMINRGKTPVYVEGRRAPLPPGLWKQAGGHWVPAYIPIIAQTDERSIVIEPGQSYRLTYQMKAHVPVPGGGVQPIFETTVPGTYRLRWALYDARTSHDSVVGPGELLPESLAVSNEFELREE